VHYYSKKAVLTNLPLTIEGDIGEWMDGLLKSLLEEMDNLLNVWIKQLQLHFAANIFKVLIKANAL
jgi:hypothetical protein